MSSAPARTGRAVIPLSLPEPDGEARAHSDRLLAVIRHEIVAGGGSIAFSRFMELALYAPGLGYYSAGATKFGEQGDFITAPEIGPMFGCCLAQALAPVLGELGAGAAMLELGGGSGAFAAAVLPRLHELGAAPASYRILEPSADLRQRQQQRLAAELDPALFARVEWLDRLPEAPWRGVLFANEVLDALPATRFTLAGGEVMEEHVGLDPQGTLQRVDRPADPMVSAAVRHLERQLGRCFDDGYRSELLVQLPYWLQAVGGSLQAGLMLFIDYGYPRGEYYLPERRDGTLICHYRHRAHADPYFLPGLQDITSFVDFTAVAEAGQMAGFELAGYCSQAMFLLGNGLDQQLQAGDDDPLAMHRRGAEARKLVMPGEMGERFKAIGLQRGMVAGAMFAAGDRGGRL
jgi:SAM-dependent MidA family methyltransferase